MNQLTFIDKIQILFQLLFSSPIIIGIFAFSMALMILLFFYSKLNKKIIKFVFIGIYVILIGFTVIKYGSYFLTSLDSFVTLFMANIYFPIIPIYVVIMLISFIIMIFTLSSKNKFKIVKIINTVFFTLIQMLFVVFIYVIEINNIDLSTNTNLYSNEQTMTLLELGMGLFIVWILILLVVLYLKKADKIFKTKKSEEQEDFDEYINDYNEPQVNNEAVDIGFNTNIVQSLVPEASSFLEDDEVISFDEVENNSFNNPDMVLDTNPFEHFDYVNSSFEKDLETLSDSVSASTDTSEFQNTLNPDFVSTQGLNELSSNPKNVFDNFDFLNTSNTFFERKDDDVEIIDL